MAILKKKAELERVALARRRRLPHRQPGQVQHPRAGGLADPDDRLLRPDRPRDDPRPRPGGPRRASGATRSRSSRSSTSSGASPSSSASSSPTSGPRPAPRPSPSRARSPCTSPASSPSAPRRDRPRLRRQGPHHRPPRRGQDPDAPPGRPQTAQDDRRPYPEHQLCDPRVSPRSPHALSPVHAVLRTYRVASRAFLA